MKAITETEFGLVGKSDKFNIDNKPKKALLKVVKQHTHEGIITHVRLSSELSRLLDIHNVSDKVMFFIDESKYFVSKVNIGFNLKASFGNFEVMCGVYAAQLDFAKIDSKYCQYLVSNTPVKSPEVSNLYGNFPMYEILYNPF